MRIVTSLFLLLTLCFTTCSSAAEYDPIALYLSWERSPDTTMTVRWITGPKRKDNEVQYRKPSSSQWKTAYGSYMPMPNGHPYLIHSVELIQLEPNQDYLFRTGSHAKVYKFRTMPSDLEGPIRFVVGGDMYHNGLSLVHETNLQAAQTDPMFALVGGDIAYAADNGFSLFPDKIHRWLDDWRGQKLERWLAWLAAWKKDMLTSDGRLIPMITTIGNHDTNGRFGQTPAEAPYFYAFFAMPGPRGYNVLDFGNYMSLFVLDSGHTHPIEDSQENWLDDSLSARSHIPLKFALYHVPAYPSVRAVENKHSSQVREHWVPLFEKHNLTAAFENHDHAYKRTFPILHGRVDAAGVLYFGDGAWGVKKTRTPKNDRWYLAKTASVRHFLLVTLGKDRVDFTAIASTGEVLDQEQIITTEPAEKEGLVRSRGS